MINHEYLEKYCIDKVNELGKQLRDVESFYASKKMASYKNDKILLSAQMDIYTNILMIIAQEVAYAQEQNN